MPSASGAASPLAINNDVLWFVRLGIEQQFFTQAQCRTIALALGAAVELGDFAQRLIDDGITEDVGALEVLAGLAITKGQKGPPPEDPFAPDIDGELAATVEAARGMGMSPAQVLRRVELPLAWPVLMAGIRTAAVVNVGTAALATFVGAGGLGDLITAGLDNQRDRVLYTGAALTALLALAVDWALAALTELTAPQRPS